MAPTKQSKSFRRAYVAALAALLLFAATAALHAQIPGQNPNSQRIGKRLMCMCGCNQVLVECNHVGCSTSTAMLKELDERVARNESEDLVIQSFIQEYGEKVLSQPPTTKFGLVAWVMPGLMVLLGVFIIRAVLLRWKRQTLAAAGVAGSQPDVSPELLERARHEVDLDDEFDAGAAGGKKR